MTKLFQILVPDNTLVSRIIFCENQVTELFVIDRADKNFVTAHTDELSKPALYILVNRDKRMLYVGETDDSLTRLRNHESKDFWTEAIVFHSTSDTLSTTEVKWLEAKTYETLAQLGYYDLSENKKKPQLPPLKKHMIYNLEPIFEEAKKYICAAGFDIFLKKKDKEATAPVQKEIDFPETPTTKERPEIIKNLPRYVSSLRGEIIKNVMQSMGLDKTITNIDDIPTLNSIREKVREEERKADIHHQYSCSISQYIKYIEAGLSYSDMEQDAVTVSGKSRKPKAKPKNPKKQKRAERRPPFKFHMADLKPGDIITFKPTGIQAMVATDTTIVYEGSTYSLSRFCKVFMPVADSESKAYQGPSYFTYNGKTLDEIRKEKENKYGKQQIMREF